MRNIFDQFAQPENRLTHALASVLALSPTLCRRFVRWAVNFPVPADERRLHVEQQRVPGTPEPVDEGEPSSRPDACIYGDGNWCVVIESKVGADLGVKQLERHRRMAKRAFDDVHVLAITAEEKPADLPTDICHRTWVEVFEWLGDNATVAPSWVDRLREYMRLLESRLLAEGYGMGKSSITTFDGIRFGANHPYSHREAKLLLRQLMELLRRRKRLLALGASLEEDGRPRITGKEGSGVWDVISLRPRERKGKGDFTSWPHLTIFINATLTRVVVTVPNNVATAYRKRLSRKRDDFVTIARRVEREVTRHVAARDGFQPVLILSQRHFRGRQVQIEDGRLNFDLRTIRGNRRHHIKRQPHWIALAFDLFADKRGANVQLQIGADFLHEGGYLSTVEAPERIEAVWLACKPILDAMPV